MQRNSTTKSIPQAGKHIQFDRICKDYSCYLNGEYLGSAATYSEAESRVNEAMYQQLSRSQAPVPTEEPSAHPESAVASLPAELQSEAQSLAWDLFQNHGYDLHTATIEAVATVADLMAYASEWDAQTKPTQPTPDAASRKARYLAEVNNIAPVPTRGGWLIASATRNVIHFVSLPDVNGAVQCSCEAGRSGKRCWHVAMVVDTVTEQAA